MTFTFMNLFIIDFFRTRVIHVSIEGIFAKPNGSNEYVAVNTREKTFVHRVVQNAISL